MDVVITLKIFGVALLSIGVVSIIAGEVRRNKDTGDDIASDRAEASISSTAIRFIGQPALVFGICCLMMAFVAELVPKPKPDAEVEVELLPSVEVYSEGGPGALLITLPHDRAVQLFNGVVVIKYELSFKNGPKVSGALLSKSFNGSYEYGKLSCEVGEQCFMKLDDGRVFRIDILSYDRSKRTVIMSIHPTYNNIK